MIRESISSRKSSKAGDIAAEIRRLIITGEYRPGDRLPTQEQLRRRTGTAVATVQRVYDLLGADGFLGSRSPAGTYVSESPPHLCRYGIVFPSFPFAAPPDGTFMSTLALLCRMRGQGNGHRMAMFFGIDEHTDVPDYPRVLEDLAAHRLAALLIATNPQHLAETPLVAQDGIPKVTVGASACQDVPNVTTDPLDWIRRTLDMIAGLDRRRVAVISTGMYPQWFECLDREAAERGLFTRPHWRMMTHRALPEGARNAVHLLLEAREPPDALLIADDIFTGPALAGILDAGLRIGDDLEVIAHCNFPLVRPDMVPVRRVGFSVSQVLKTAIDTADAMRRGETPPACSLVPAVTADEEDAAAGQAPTGRELAEAAAT